MSRSKIITPKDDPSTLSFDGTLVGGSSTTMIDENYI